MLLHRWKRNFKEGFKNLGRNKIFTIASIATMTLCIFLIGLFFAIGYNVLVVMKNVETNVPVTVFFDKGTTQEKQKEIFDNIKSNTKVKSATFKTADEAWKEYKKVYFKDVPELAEGFKDDNPLADSASISVYMKNINEQASYVNELRALTGVRQVNHSADVADKLSTFNSAFSYVAVIVVIVLLFIAVFLISNTVSIGISVRKEEVSIMQYVGAKDKFIRGPFVTEGLIIGLFGVAIPLVLEYIVYSQALSYLTKHFELLNDVDTFVPVVEVFKFFVPVALVIGFLISFLASRFTISRYLNK